MHSYRSVGSEILREMCHIVICTVNKMLTFFWCEKPIVKAINGSLRSIT